MRTIQMILPPRLGLVFLAIMAVMWSQQHPVQAFADGWILPVSPPAKLVGVYRAPATEYAAGHRGIDYKVKDGQQLRAPFTGEVRFLGKVAKKPVITLIHSGGYVTSYEPACSTLKVGDQVRQGEAFAKVCAAGYRSHCKSLCLHYGLRIGREYLSPLALSGAIAPSHTVHALG